MSLLIADALFHLRDGRADAHHLLDHFAGVARCGHGPFHRSARRVLISHALVAGEAAGVDQHTQARLDSPGLVRS